MSFKGLKLFLGKRSPEILTVVSVIGIVATVVTASQDTIKAQDILKKMKPRDKREAIKITWKCYIPTAISATTTCLSIFGITHFSNKQKKALSAYALSQTTLFQEYQKRVIDQIGQNKERCVYEETTKAIADRQAPVIGSGPYIGMDDVIDTGHGSTLFYDQVSERYFKSDMLYIGKTENDINREVRSEMYFDWNEILYRLGQPYKEYGDTLIVDVDHPLEFKTVPEIMENGQVRIILDYKLYPVNMER